MCNEWTIKQRDINSHHHQLLSSAVSLHGSMWANLCGFELTKTASQLGHAAAIVWPVQILSYPHCCPLRVLIYTDSSLQNCYGETSWVRMCGKNWGIRHQFSLSKEDFLLTSFSLPLIPLHVSVFVWGCLHVAIWCHLKTPELSQNNWTLEEADLVQKSSVRAPEHCSANAFYHFWDAHSSSQLELDILQYLLLLLRPLTLSGRALDLKTTCLFVVSLFKAELPRRMTGVANSPPMFLNILKGIWV